MLNDSKVWILLVTLVLISGCFSFSAPKQTQSADNCASVIAELPQIIEENQGGRTVSVTKVLDGDTVELNNGQKVRFIGINTPEKGKKFSTEAANLTAELVSEGIIIVMDAEPEDQYNRLLRYVFTSDTFVNAKLVRQGLATTFPVSPNTKYAELFKCLELEAKENKVGLWSSPFSDFGLNISVNFDAAGSDLTNLNGEFVTIINNGNEAIDLSGWSLKDQATHFYYFENIVLEPGESLVIYTGSGSNTATEVFWNSDEPIWNNNGDTVFLFDSEGNLVTSLSFP